VGHSLQPIASAVHRFSLLGVRFLQFHLNEFLVGASGDGTVKIWDTSLRLLSETKCLTGEEYRGKDGSTTTILLSGLVIFQGREGRRLVTHGTSSGLKIWGLDGRGQLDFKFAVDLQTLTLPCML
jgi:WD40 repeat protein